MLSIDDGNIISRAGTNQLQHLKTDPLKTSRKNFAECGPDLDAVILEYLEEMKLVRIPLQVKSRITLFELDCLLKLNSFHCNKQKY